MNQTLVPQADLCAVGPLPPAPDPGKAVTGTSFTESNTPLLPMTESAPMALWNVVPVTAFLMALALRSTWHPFRTTRTNLYEISVPCSRPGSQAPKGRPT